MLSRPTRPQELPHTRAGVQATAPPQPVQRSEDADRNRWLSPVVQLAPGAKERDQMRKAIVELDLTHLLRLNSEFARYAPAEHRRPRVGLRPSGDPEYFPNGVKYRYTRR
jgi:phenylacetate-CoA ligase